MERNTVKDRQIFIIHYGVTIKKKLSLSYDIFILYYVLQAFIQT